MAASLRIRRSAALGLLVCASFALSACPTNPRPAPAPAATAPTETSPRLALDPSLSPIPFRWLSYDSVLIAPNVGTRKLAGFGNYLERAAKKRELVRLAVWDDEDAWKAAHENSGDDEKALEHKRALYVKNTGGPAPVENYATFGPSGEVLYERDFRAYPLSDFDEE